MAEIHNIDYVVHRYILNFYKGERKMKSTKRSLLVSVLAITLCLAMLLGTTYAWFTDSVQSGVNRIVAGNLDVEMLYKSQLEGAQWENVTEAPASNPGFFVNKTGEKILWEPGVVSVASFKVESVGTLALKYKFATNVADGNNADSAKKLSEVIKAVVIDGEQTYATREAAIAAGGENFQSLSTFKKNGFLSAKDGSFSEGGNTYDDNDIFTVILYWAPTENDNDYNMNNLNQGKEMWIDFDVSLFATQYTVESDSFDKLYDKDAEYPDGSGDNENQHESTVTAMLPDPTVETTISADFDPVLGFKSIEAKIPEGTFDGPVNMVVTSEDGGFLGEEICISFVDPVEKDENGDPKVINPKKLIEITKIVAAEPFVGNGYPSYYVAVDCDPDGENYDQGLIWEMMMMTASSVVSP